ncbi:MAG: aldehyde dehydrogenase family protein [Candidatus Glassbacteria bacterium]|nr:aldehyde dehydrogenase family protein [Candidatus Glassbacteria bacterium]
MSDNDIRTQLFIGGEWVESDESFPVVNPYDESELAPVSAAGPEHLEQAVRAAAASGMEDLTAHRRYLVLDEVSRRIKDEREKLTSLIVREAGKPVRYAAGEVERAVQTFSFAAGEARRLHGSTMELDAHPEGKDHFAFYHRFPLGIIGAISPFNFPLNLVAHKVAPALAAGNSVILKPASTTPLVALELARIISDAGAPPGAINVLPGSGSKLGSPLVEHPDVAMITFTGSLEVGRRIRRDAGMKRVTLELGSNSALIVDDDSRLDEAVSRSIIGAFAYSGQVCISIQRILLRSSLAGRFIEQFVPAVEKIRAGDPADQATELGPMIEEAEARRAQEWVDEAVAQGASVLTGGRRDGAFYSPTVLEDVEHDMKVYSSEVFAPVVCIERYDDFDDALERVNNSEYGLQAGVYTSSLPRAMEAFRRLEVGGVMINDFPTYRVDQMPYGGVKGSGTGREGPKFAVEDMTELKLCVFNN